MFQLRLATLLGVVTLSAALLAGWRFVAEPYRIQFEAEQELDVYGAEFDFVPGRPGWFARFVDPEQFHRVVMYRVDDRRLRDEQLERLGHLPHLERVYLARTEIGDGAAPHIGRLERLRRLSLWRTRLSDIGLRDISHCEELRALDIHETCVTDAGLGSLLPLAELRELKLGGPIYGPGLRYVARLPRLQVLDLSQTQVDFAELEYLAGSPVRELVRWGTMHAREIEHLLALPQLQRFPAHIVEADDDALRRLSACRHLETVHVTGTGITDVGVTALVGMPRLRHLYVHGDLNDASLDAVTSATGLRELHLTGRFSLEGIKRLTTARPELEGILRTVVPSSELELPGHYWRGGSTSLSEISGFNGSRLTLASLIELSVDRYSRGFPQAGGDTYVRVQWPATVRDVVDLSDSYRIRKLEMVNPPSAYPFRDSRFQATWSLDGIEELEDLTDLWIHRVPRDELSRLSALPSLGELVIRDDRFSDDDLEFLHLPDSVHHVYFAPSQVTPAGLQRFNAMYLGVAMRENGHGTIFGGDRWQCPSIGQGSIRHLPSIPGIRTVQLGGISGPVDLDSLANLPELENLHLSGRTDLKSLWRLSTTLPNVRELYASRIATSDREMAYLRFLPNLEKASLSDTQVSDNGLRHFAHTPRLRTLYLERAYSLRHTGPWITGRTLDVLAGCPDLETLKLEGSYIQSPALATLLRNTRLRELGLSRTEVDDRGCEILARHPALERIELQQTRITDEGLKFLAQSSRLKMLIASRNEIGDEGLRAMAECASLEYISVQDTNVTQEGIDWIKSRRPDLVVSY